MLTGALEPSKGSFSYRGGGDDVKMGYCPQENALDSLLTAGETLRVYSLIRGIQGKSNRVRVSFVVVVVQSAPVKMSLHLNLSLFS